ncbi:hypothetical protein HMPREF9004_1920 [Schaalia cardiffensis F0333]|uniref:Uncharacterized protein n=1 Tax=Schaalia cardiffensis F0333 TaxID=888050 RepID=N6X882_9ACTO|nr:hypothetical protein HMPREF9004_1920 [Schaalia cardiffensis F0333]
MLQVLLAARHIGLFSPRGSLVDADDGVDANPRSSTSPGY